MIDLQELTDAPQYAHFLSRAAACLSDEYLGLYSFC
jgi:hypothetical protein